MRKKAKKCRLATMFCQMAFLLHNDELELIDFALLEICKSICLGERDSRINRKTSFPVPPMGWENSDGNYPEKGLVRRKGV